MQSYNNMCPTKVKTVFKSPVIHTQNKAHFEYRFPTVKYLIMLQYRSSLIPPVIIVIHTHIMILHLAAAVAV